jgi:hypothetical protein
MPKIQVIRAKRKVEETIEDEIKKYSACPLF